MKKYDDFNKLAEEVGFDGRIQPGADMNMLLLRLATFVLKCVKQMKGKS